MKRPTTLIAEIIARLCFPLILLFALYLLLAGHNNPGGGFIAGVMTAAALALQYVVFGLRDIERVIPSRTMGPGLVALGLGLALGTGVGSLLLGRGFLTSGIVHLRLPFVGEIDVVSVFLFDVGIFCIVVGVAVSVIAFLGRERP